MPTVANIHTVGTLGGVDEFAAVSDAEIQELIDEVLPQYGGRVLGPPEHAQREKAIILHVAHLLHLSLTAAGAGGGQLGNLFPTTTRQLEGVGSRGKGGAFGQWGGNGTDPLEIPSRYLWRLTQIRKTMMPSVDTTGGDALSLAGLWSGIPYGGNGWY